MVGDTPRSMVHLKRNTLLRYQREYFPPDIHILEVGVGDELLQTLQGDLSVAHHGLVVLHHAALGPTVLIQKGRQRLPPVQKRKCFGTRAILGHDSMEKKIPRVYVRREIPPPRPRAVQCACNCLPRGSPSLPGLLFL